MRQPTRKQLVIAATLLASAGVVTTGSAMASSAGQSAASKAKGVNATTLNGYKAKDLVHTNFIRDNNILDEFDPGCTFTTELTLPVKAPRNGYLAVTGSAAAARDTDHPDPAELVIRLKAGSKVFSGSQATQLTTDGSYDGNVSVIGTIGVKKGSRTVHLQMAECAGGDSAAYVTTRSLSALFVPFGTVKNVAIVPRTAAGTNR